MSTKYDADYFINKFEAIPDEKWIAGEYEAGGCCCALGHCGVRFVDGDSFPRIEDTEEGNALSDLFNQRGLSVPVVNDRIDVRYQQPTPKARVLAALADIKKGAQTHA